MSKAKDSFTMSGAALLSKKITKYWADRGHNVRTWIEPIDVRQSTEFDNAVTFYQVRSDMVDGLPRAA